MRPHECGSNRESASADHGRLPADLKRRSLLVHRTIQAGTQEMQPETYARFDLHCVFNKLDYLTLNRIGQVHVEKCLDLIRAQGHSIECQSGVVEYVQREGYSERFGARPMQNAAMRILGSVVMDEMMKNGGRPVMGEVAFDRKANKCFFKRL
jgi:ATP-dependent Clp protease ATP-binding subunit ClpA